MKTSLQGLDVKDIAMLLLGLRAIHVSEEIDRHERLMHKLEIALSSHGARLGDGNENARAARS